MSFDARIELNEEERMCVKMNGGGQGDFMLGEERGL